MLKFPEDRIHNDIGEFKQEVKGLIRHEFAHFPPDAIEQLLNAHLPIVQSVSIVNDPIEGDKYNCIIRFGAWTRAFFIWDEATLAKSLETLRHEVYTKLSSEDRALNG